MQEQHINFNVRARAHIGDYSCNIFSSHNARKSFYCSLACLAVFFLSFLFVPYAALHASASQYADATVNWGAVSLTLDPDYGNGNIDDEGHGDIRFGELVPTENNLATSGSSYGTLKVLKKTIGITSSGKYYSVYLSTSSSDNNLLLELSGGGTNSSIYIPALSSTFATPAGFADSGWGFAVPGVENTDVPDAPSTFVVPALLDTQIGAQTTVTGAASTYTTTKWSGVPASSAPQMIWEAEAEGTAGQNYGFGTYMNNQNVEVTGDTTNNHFDVYYAVAVDTDVLAGTYSNNIVYTALASASSLDTVSTNLMHDLSAGGSGDTVTLRFDLTQSTTTLSASDITVTLVPHTTMVANGYDQMNFDINDLGSADTPGYLNCPVVDGSIVVDGYVELECTMPAASPIEENSASAYDFWVHVNGYNYNYISKDTYNSSLIASFTYAGLQSEYPSTDARYSSAQDADNHIVTEMQQMTAGICSNTNLWNNQTGSNARIYDHNALRPLVSDATDEGTYSSVEARILAENAALGTGSFALTDNRDDKLYLVRRLADGNCWMVQNLDLEPSTVGTLNSSNTDLAEGTTWDPYASTNTKISTTYATALADAGLTSDFAGLSQWLLGSTDASTAQQYQYQPQGTYGTNYRWGSYRESDDETVSDLQTKAAAGGTPFNNKYAEFPRSYSNTKSDGSIMYANTDGLTGTTYNGEGTVTTTSGLTESSWHGDRNTFYGSEYFGHYYNWYAATAETGTFAQTSGNASGSLCPAGWQLPVNSTTSGDKSWYNLIQSDDYYNLIDTVGAQTADNSNFPDASDPTKEAAYRMHQIPLSIPFTGNYNWPNGSLNNRGGSGFFWSSTASSQASARYLGFSGTVVSPQGSNGKVVGFTVRCVAKEDSNASETSSCPAGKICYDANGGSGDALANQSASASSSARLAASTYTRDGAAFVGWSTSADGYGELYTAHQQITTPDTLGSTGLQLYAKWLYPTDTMQDFTAAKCAALPLEVPTALTDERDGNVYAVTRLADGNCWMTSNLALNLADFAGTQKLTSANTDISASRGYWDPAASVNAKISQYSAKLDANSLTHDFTGLSSLLLGQAQPAQFQSSGQTGYTWSSAYQDDGNGGISTSRTANTSGNSVTLSGTTYTVANNANAEMPRSYHEGNDTYGDYYNYYAATAESGTYAMASDVDASDSICPAGWQLPVNGGSTTDKSWNNLLNNDSYYNLIDTEGPQTADNSNFPDATDPTKEAVYRMHQIPLSIPFTGLYSWAGALVNRGGVGYFWSSTANSQTNARFLYFYGAGVYPQNNYDKVGGFTVRCILK